MHLSLRVILLSRPLQGTTMQMVLLRSEFRLLLLNLLSELMALTYLKFGRFLGQRSMCMIPHLVCQSVWWRFKDRQNKSKLHRVLSMHTWHSRIYEAPGQF